MKMRFPLVLSTAMAFSLFSSAVSGVSAAKSSADFTDLQNLDAATKAQFDAMISAGIFAGVGDHLFGLKDKMNRAQFARVAALIFHLPVDTSLKTSSFRDVRADDPANGYALPYIEALKKANLTAGITPDTYNPAGEVTKEQLAAFLLRGLHKDASAQAASGASDRTVSGWAKGYAALALQTKLMRNGADGLFHGTEAATRELLVTSSYAAKQQYDAGSASAVSGSIAAVNDPVYAVSKTALAQIKGVLQEKTADGYRIGAVIKLSNTTGSTVRIPDYELRVKAADGTVYTLSPSAGNAVSISPNSYVELTYLTEINGQSDLNLQDLLWVYVNEDVYPKQEKVLADAPIRSIVWRGKDAVIQDPTRLGKWGDSFSVPGVSSALKYSAFRLSQQFEGQNPVYLVQLKVVNTGSYTETVPNFTLGGKSEGQLYIGQRVEQSAVTVKPGEQKYVNFAITAGTDAQLTGIYVLTPGSFVQTGQNAPVLFYTGRIGFGLPAAGATPQSGTGSAYEYGTAISFDPNNGFVNPDLQISLVELHVSQSEENGSKTAFAKFKLDNNGAKPIPVPGIATELVTGSGISYSGVRQASTVPSVQPGTSAVVSYGFTLPISETAASFLLNIQGTVQSDAAGPAYRSTIASLPVNVQSDDDRKSVHLYPYTLNIKSWVLVPVMQSVSSYSYKLYLDMDLTRDPKVILDNSFSTLKVELIDGLGVSLGAHYFPFEGTNRLVSGDQTLLFPNITSDQASSNITVKVSESIQTPNGEMNRVIAILNP